MIWVDIVYNNDLDFLNYYLVLFDDQMKTYLLLYACNSAEKQVSRFS